MNYLQRPFALLLLIIFPLLANAVDIPTHVEGAEFGDIKQCIAINLDDCIQSVCMYSSDTDCEEKCKSYAADKCKELNEE